MDAHSMHANVYAYVRLLQGCIKSKALSQGKRVHSHILKCGLNSNIILGNTLINMYFKCGSANDAREIFDKMPQRTVVTWTIMIAGYSQQGQVEEALLLFQQMKKEGVKPDKATFISILKACAIIADLEKGRHVHALITKNGYQSDIVVGNTLIDMYAKCRSMVDAHEMFNKMPTRDVVSWNTLISGYTQHGEGEKALELFQQMEQKGLKPNEFTFVSILKACATIAALEWGKKIHAVVIKGGFESNVFVASTLVDMYSKCGSIDYAQRVFDKMPKRDVVSWTALIAGYAQLGQIAQVVDLFKQMEKDGVRPNKVTFVSMLKGCTNAAALEQGKQIHASIIDRGYELDLSVASALIDMYAKFGHTEFARKLFNKMPTRNIVSWTAMIAGYAQHGQVEEAFGLFAQMEREGAKANQVTFVSILQACTSATALEQGKQIHAHIIKSGFESDVFVASSLIDMYAKCGSIKQARSVFDKIPRQIAVPWNAMITGYVQHGQVQNALALFRQMEQEGVKPDKVTFVSVLKACAGGAALEWGKQIHDLVTKSRYESDTLVGSVLVDMYAKCGSTNEARRLFDKIPKRDVVLWTAMIAGYAQNGKGEEALNLFHKMQVEGMKPDKVTFVSILKACASLGALEQGKHIHSQIIHSGFESDIFVGSTLVDMYAKCGSVEHACQVFYRIPKRDVVTWNAMIAGYIQHGQNEKALSLFRQMEEEGVNPNEMTFTSVLKACSSIAAIDQGKRIHMHIAEYGFESDLFVGSALIDMYAKCGSIEDACRVFEKLPKRDIVAWNAIILAYAQHGHGKGALQLFKQMQEDGIALDHISFVSILTACSYAGLVDEGHHLFDAMSQDHNITPTDEHYACMINLLCLTGNVAEAEEFIRRMPIQPSSVVWTSLLNACRVDGNVELAKWATECILQVEPHNTAASVLLSNTYAAAGEWEEKAKSRKVGDKGTGAQPH